MKKLFIAVFGIVLAASFASAANKETPASIYEKIIDRSYVGKYQSIIIDKEVISSQMPDGLTVKSRTYFADDKFREETQTKDKGEQSLSIVTIFTSSDTFISYDGGERFFSIGTSLVEEIGENIKNIDPFSTTAILHEKTETINGSECYVIEDNSDGVNKKFYIEKKTYNPLKSVISTDEMLVVTDMSDYKKVNKYTAPFTIRILFQQKTGDKQVIDSTVKISSVQFNPAIDKNIFTPKNVSALPDIPGMGNIKEMLQSLF